MADIVGTGTGETLTGTGDADTITALGGNDTVNAGGGNDTINGGTGNDTLNGEDGDDTFIEDEFTSPTDIFNGGIGFDTIELRAALAPITTIFGSTTSHTLSAGTAMVSIERLLFASQPGQVVQAILGYGTWAGSGITQIIGGAGRDLITVSAGAAAGTYTMPSLPISGWDTPPLNAWDFAGDMVILSSSASAATSVTLNAASGASFFQLLSGGLGNDILNGSANADYFNASRGGDTVNAGNGNDAIAIANAAAPVGGNSWGAPSTFTGAGGTWDGGDGTDVISIGGAVNLQATLLNIEGVHLQDAFIPPAFNTTLQYAAELTLDSTHIAMLPANAFFTGNGSVIFDIDDTQSFSAENYIVNVGSDVSMTINGGNGDGLTFTGSARDDFINMGVGSQTALGGDGDDVLNNGSSSTPGAGNIAMFGGDGDDILILDNIAQNNLTLNGGDGTDLLQLHSYSATSPTGANIVHVATSTNGGGISEIEAVQFNSLAGFSMQFIADLNAGFSTIIGGSGSDQMIFTVTSAGTYSMPDFSLLNWNSFQGDFVGFGVAQNAAYAVTLNGRNDIGQYFFGGLAADTLNGGALDDRLFGRGGANIVNGNGGNDVIFLDAGANGSSLDGGSGSDVLNINGTTASLANFVGFESLQFVGGASLTLTGSQFANGLLQVGTTVTGSGSLTINMDAGVNFQSQNFAFSGVGVTVTVNGTSGIDIIKAGTAVHIINGGDGVDQIRGGTAADTINGDAGNDKIIGNTGADIITGGSGSDQFRYLFDTDSGLGANADRITDFTIGGDKLNFLLIDADAVTAGDQAFNFVGTGAFANTGVGQIRYQNSGADLLVQVDVDGNGTADMEIILQGNAGGTLTAGDFIL
ncbi:beta strand repeat-containing protein [Sphingorhabdus sp.]|uniref:beta strand repeat-containing protein n=2 Tax=Sphingorhabdus sp. TaxID=1902408 RepID=UPI003BB05FB0|nr:hypothetical protein [Sphingomonadales bacterium]MBK9432358.1 hypothetical protein [Sphingomonadales bacterium]